jgi:cobalt-precorrin 5A hydrolase
MSKKRLAIWALTPQGATLADKVAGHLTDGADRFFSGRLCPAEPGARAFEPLADALAREFGQYQGHIFIMATGIVVRSIAGLLKHKTRDPAVVVMDEAGRFAISLLAGHIGGANALAAEVARITGGQAVITTATDVNHLPAIDVLAGEKGLGIENPAAIKTVHMALLCCRPVRLHDPYRLLGGVNWPPNVGRKEMCGPPGNDLAGGWEGQAGIFVDDVRMELPARVLVLRPRSLVAGMGCNRHAAMQEMMDLLLGVLDDAGLARGSLSAIASVDLKADEPGLLALAKTLALDLHLFSAAQLNSVQNVPNPSKMVEKHLGVQSVCEAAAILGSGSGSLIVPKQTTRNVTLAIARRAFTS